MNFLKRFVPLIYQLFCLFPLQEKTVLVQSFSGDTLGGNPKYIALALRHERFRIFVVSKKKLMETRGLKQVKKNSLKYLYLLAVAKYHIINTRQSPLFLKRKGSVIIQTWHGTPLKKLVFDVAFTLENSHSDEYKEFFRKQAEDWDYLLSQNSFSTKVFRSAFNYKGKILEEGYPRNEIFYSKEIQESADRNLQTLHIPKDKKIVLYTPTFRDNDRDSISFSKDVLEAVNIFHNELILLVRVHYITAPYIKDFCLKNRYTNILDVTDYPDVNELMYCADCLITDYSSTMFDFSNSGKPMLFYVPDLEYYEKELRGFYFDYQTMIPGPIMQTKNDVIETLKAWLDSNCSFNNQYCDSYAAFQKHFNSLDNGETSKRIIDRIGLLK